MSSMGDLVHRCLGCNELAYETDVEYCEHTNERVYVLYKCSKCDFSWEVMSCNGEGPV